MPLDPDIAAMIADDAALDLPPLPTLTPEQARDQFHQTLELRRGAGFVPEEVASVADHELATPGGPLRARVYEPADAIAATVVYLHGGGWVIGDLETHDPICRMLANQTRARVAAIEYRLAPESPHPGPLADCLAGLGWVAERFGSQTLAVAGDSAGGALAAGVALAARDAGGPALAAQLLVYPAMDPTLGQPSVARNAAGYMLERADMVWFYDHYLPEPAMREDPAVNLLVRDDLAGLPPAVVAVAEFDPLHDEGVRYAERLRAAGVPVTMVEGPGLIHGFYGMGPVAPAAARVVAEAHRAFAAHLA